MPGIPVVGDARPATKPARPGKGIPLLLTSLCASTDTSLRSTDKTIAFPLTRQLRCTTGTAPLVARRSSAPRTGLTSTRLPSEPGSRPDCAVRPPFSPSEYGDLSVRAMPNSPASIVPGRPEIGRAFVPRAFLRSAGAGPTHPDCLVRGRGQAPLPNVFTMTAASSWCQVVSWWFVGFGRHVEACEDLADVAAGVRARGVATLVYGESLAFTS